MADLNFNALARPGPRSFYQGFEQGQENRVTSEINQMKLDELRRDRDEMLQLREQLKGLGQDPDPTKYLDALARTGNPKYVQMAIEGKQKIKDLEAYAKLGVIEPVPAVSGMPTSTPGAIAAPSTPAMPSSAPGAMAAPAELAAGAQPEPMAPVPGVISTSRVPGVTTAPITAPKGTMREIAPGGAMGAEMPFAPANALAPPAAAPVNAMTAPTPTPPNALAAQPNAAQAAATQKRIEQLLGFARTNPRFANQAMAEARLLQDQLELYSKRGPAPAAPSEIGKLEAEIAALVQNGAPPDDPGIVARRGKISQLSGARAPTQLSRLIAERDALPPNSPIRAQYDAAIKKETTQAPGVTVTNVQERAESGAYGKMLVDQFGDISKQASVAARTLPSIDANLALLNKGLDTGFGTDAKAAGARVLGALGVQNAEKYATDTQTFQANAISAVLQKQLEQKGVQTDQDAKRIEQIGAQLGKTKEANEFILSVAREQLKRDIEQRNFYTNWKSGPGKGSFDGAENAWFSGEGGKSLFDRPALKKFAVQGTSTAPARAAATIPQAAINDLKSGRGTDAQFDAIFGPGAAKQAREGK